MVSAMAPFESLAEDLAWFVTCPEIRILHVATGGEERPIVLEQVAMTEGHPCNRSPFFVLEDAHAEGDDGWQVRADRMRVIHDARREAMAAEGYPLCALDPRPTLDAGVAAFAAQLTQTLAAQTAVRELEGIVVVLAPAILESSAEFAEALVRCAHDPAYAAVRFIVIELGESASPPLAAALGTAAMSTRCERDPASAAADRKALLAPGIPALPGASPEMQAGFAGPKDVVAPTRHAEGPRDALRSPEVEAATRETVGAEAALAGPRGALLKGHVFAAALAMQERRHDDAIRAQTEARDLCLEAGMVMLGSLLEITLATYLLHAGRSADARAAYGASASRAAEAQMFNVAAQARPGLAAALTVDRELAAASVEYVLAGEAALRAESSLLAIECFRLAGQHARRAGAEDVAVNAWRAALDVASASGPEVSKASPLANTAKACHSGSGGRLQRPFREELPMSQDACCRSLEPGSTSPFEIVMLGWQDGLTSGMARCRSCGSTYHFEMVAWDAEQEVRIYGFRVVSRNSYDAVATLNAAPPASEHVGGRADAVTLRTRDALATSFERTLFVAAVDLAKTVVAARRIEFPEWKEVIRF